jgi:hypothetical protein
VPGSGPEIDMPETVYPSVIDDAGEAYEHLFFSELYLLTSRYSGYLPTYVTGIHPFCLRTEVHERPSLSVLRVSPLSSGII